MGSDPVPSLMEPSSVHLSLEMLRLAPAPSPVELSSVPFPGRDVGIRSCSIPDEAEISSPFPGDAGIRSCSIPGGAKISSFPWRRCWDQLLPILPCPAISPSTSFAGSVQTGFHAEIVDACDEQEAVINPSLKIL